MEPAADASSDTKVEALAARLASAIDRGLLPQGARLRSIRDCAAKEAVARNTVVEAYNRLVARGYAEARPGSGYYVRKAAGPRTQAAAAHVSEAVDVVSLLREQLEQHYEVRVGDGRPPASWMEGSELGRHLRGGRTSALSGIEHGYGTPWGYLPLRETVARLLHERSILVDARQVLLTQGANHALDLIVRHLLQPGDVVFVDSPGYYPLFGKLKLAKVEMVGVPRLADGPDMAALDQLAQRYRPKAFFTQSLAHNPTGGSISLPCAHRLLRLAAQHDFLIVEDDPFADLMPAQSPRLAALDQLERVVYVSSFSKTLSAGLRVGYVAGSPAIIHALCDLKMVTVVSTSDFVERVVHQLVAAGHYRKHLSRLKSRLDAAQGPASRALQKLGLALHVPSTGGYYLWARLPAGLSEISLARKAAQQGIFLAPGAVFYPERVSGEPALRVNVAYAGDERFLAFMRSALKKP
ncbi:MAG: PLP-dependent aminotransferase family protein [Ramlibacter sp.]|nr:PLP-dependent aminotransferase family protein [Ramlibacter sp.]MCW5651042.1 PLP-dependent aminotransferase family protein [Ramlibacter sp.]